MKGTLGNWLGAVGAVASIIAFIAPTLPVIGLPAGKVAAPLLALAALAASGVGCRVVVHDIRRGTARFEAERRIDIIRSSPALNRIQCLYRREEQAVEILLQIFTEENSGKPNDADIETFLDAFPPRLVYTENGLGLCEVTLDHPPGIGRRIGNILRHCHAADAI